MKPENKMMSCWPISSESSGMDGHLVSGQALRCYLSQVSWNGNANCEGMAQNHNRPPDRVVVILVYWYS